MGEDLNKAEIASSIPHLWELLTEEQQQSVTDELIIRHYQQDEIIYQERDYADHGYFLLSGKVSIHYSGCGEHLPIIRMVEPCRSFGIQAIFARERQKLTAKASAHTTVAILPADLIRHLLRENMPLAMWLIQDLSELLDQNIDHTLTITQKHMRGRMATILIRMKIKYGIGADGVTLNTYLRREELARMSNMTTANAIRTLSAFADEGHVAVVGKKIQILNEKALQRIAATG